MKKIVSLILALALLLALTACGSGTSAGTAETTAPASTVDDSKGTQIDADGSVITKYDKATVSTDKELPHFKILVLYNSFTDKLGSQYKSSMEYIAEPLNIEFTFLETGSNADEATAAIEAALVNGYDGCIGTVATEARAALFDKAGVPYVVCGGMPSSEEQAKTHGYLRRLPRQRCRGRLRRRLGNGRSTVCKRLPQRHVGLSLIHI